MVCVLYLIDSCTETEISSSRFILEWKPNSQNDFPRHEVSNFDNTSSASNIGDMLEFGNPGENSCFWNFVWYFEIKTKSVS